MKKYYIVQCNTRFGLQAAIVRKMPIQSILINGLILAPKDERHYLNWLREYELLKNTRLFRWNSKEWYERGFILVNTGRSGGKGGTVLVPHPKDEYLRIGE